MRRLGHAALPAILLWGSACVSSGLDDDARPAAPAHAHRLVHDGRAEAPLRLAVISDLNGSYGATTYGEAVHGAVERIVKLHPDLVIATGDLVAGQRAGLDYGAMWSAFHEAVTTPLARAGIPLAVTPGNHDASGYRVFAREREIFVQQWRAHAPDLRFVDGSDFPLRYSFTMGPAFFVSIDATTLGPLGSEQMSWLAKQLDRAGHDRPIVVYGHVPLYAFAQGREHEVIGDPALERLLRERGVTMVLSGHHHAYYPGRRGPLRLVASACLGSGRRALIGAPTVSERSLTLIGLDRDGVRSLEAFGGAHFDVRVDRSTLPPAVGLPGMRIGRDDLDPIIAHLEPTVPGHRRAAPRRPFLSAIQSDGSTPWLGGAVPPEAPRGTRDIQAVTLPPWLGGAVPPEAPPPGRASPAP